MGEKSLNSGVVVVVVGDNCFDYFFFIFKLQFLTDFVGEFFQRVLSDGFFYF